MAGVLEVGHSCPMWAPTGNLLGTTSSPSIFVCLFVYLWLCSAFVSVRGLSLVVASGGHSSSRCAGLSLSWPLLLRSTGSRRAGSVTVAHGPSCSAACGILPDQGSNPCPLHWQADSQPLRHQGSPSPSIFRTTLPTLPNASFSFFSQMSDLQCGMKISPPSPALFPFILCVCMCVCVEAQSLNHWTAREVPFSFILHRCPSPFNKSLAHLITS